MVIISYLRKPFWEIKEAILSRNGLLFTGLTIGAPPPSRPSRLNDLGSCGLFNRPGVARAVLQSPLSFIDWFITLLTDPSVKIFSNHSQSQTGRAGIMRKFSFHTMCHMSHVTYHVSHVMCHLSWVTCHLSHVKIFCVFFFLWNKNKNKKKIK